LLAFFAGAGACAGVAGELLAAGLDGMDDLVEAGVDGAAAGAELVALASSEDFLRWLFFGAALSDPAEAAVASPVETSVFFLRLLVGVPASELGLAV
jgi:hypothetical protein